MKSAAAAATLFLAALSCAVQAASPASLSGEVLETRSVEGYTYLRLKTASGDVWAAVPTSAVGKGAQVTIGRPMTMENFESKTLKKTFDKIVFGVLDGPAAQGATPQAQTPAALPATGASKVARADGPDAKTVAEVVGSKATLKDKVVVVRGRVVKFTGGILGKNWVHLRDGSGTAADGSDDVLVTTQDKVAVGDIVSARGTVRTEVNLGAGYNYAVLIDAAALRK